MQPTGQSLVDRLLAAKNTIAGQALAKVVCKATTEEIMGPKRKHLDFLLQATNEMNVSIPEVADLLIERVQSSSWVVSFKALITIHHLMCYGNERFEAYMASHNHHFQSAIFVDRMAMPGMDMIAYIRRYANYLNEKRDAYKIMGFDFCKIKRGKDDGLLRMMPAEKLLKTLPVLQKQLDALLQFDVTSNELANGILNSCFFLLVKDLIRLYAAFNDGMINLLEKYFDMNKKQCRDGLDTYRKFIDRTDKVSTFLKLAETSGIEHNEIPDLSRAPSSLLEALENHLAHIEGKKISSQSLVSKHQTEQDLKNFSQDFVVNDSDDPQKILEEEAKALAHFSKAKESSSPPPPPPVVASSTKPTTMKNGSSLASHELLTDDLFSIIAPASQPMPYTTHNVFDTTVPKSNFFEDILQPTSVLANKNISTVPLVSNNQNIPPAAKLLQSGDLNSSLNHLFEHLDMKDRSKIGKDHQWTSGDAKNQPKIGIGAGMVNTPGTTWSGSSSLQSGSMWSQAPTSMGPNGLTPMNFAGLNSRSTSASTNPFASHAPYHPQS